MVPFGVENFGGSRLLTLGLGGDDCLQSLDEDLNFFNEA